MAAATPPAPTPIFTSLEYCQTIIWGWGKGDNSYRLYHGSFENDHIETQRIENERQASQQIELERQ